MANDVPDGGLQREAPFIDTFRSGRPIIFSFGSVGTAPGKITPGLEEAIGDSRTGSRLRVAVPPSRGYPEGLSRYDAYQAGLPAFSAVPPAATLRYEIEILRCVEASGSAGLCCSEEKFPCKLPTADEEGAL